MPETSGWMVRPIGLVRSPVRDRRQMPPLGVPAAVELFPEYAPGLLRLEKHSHLWVLAWMDGAERDLLQVVPRGVRPEDPDALHGVFAVRSPARPNPIGLTLARILRWEGRRIELSPLDFADGTPVVDLKPYFLSRDVVFSAANAPIGRPADRERLRESLLEQAVNFHGECCAELVLAVRVIEHFRWEMLDRREPLRWRVALPWRRGCLVDAVMGMTRATPGRGNLRPLLGARLRLDYEGVSYDYELRARALRDPAAVLQAPDDELFAVRVSPCPD